MPNDMLDYANIGQGAQGLIESREKSHGEFEAQSECSQAIKELIRAGSSWDDLKVYQRESLDMVAVKMSRIAHGDPFDVDHWKDLQGYCQLVINKLMKGTTL